MLRKLPVALLTGFAALGVVACTQTGIDPSLDVQQGVPTRLVTDQPQVQIIGFARWPIAEAKSLKELAESHSTIVVGVVTAATDLTAPTASEDHAPDPPPADHPKAGLQPRPYVPGEDPPTLTGYSVRVTTVLKGAGIRPGDTVTVHQAGGMRKGTAYQLEHDPVIQIGAAYLFFLKDADGSALAGPPYGRFQVGRDNRLTPADSYWESLGAVKELSGLSVEEALRRVSNAKAGSQI